MLFVGTSIIHPSTEGVFLLCNILDLLIYSLYIIIIPPISLYIIVPSIHYLNSKQKSGHSEIHAS